MIWNIGFERKQLLAKEAYENKMEELPGVARGKVLLKLNYLNN